MGFEDVTLNQLARDITRYEEGELDPSLVIKLFSDLIRTGVINHLQGSYQREAMRLIEAEILNPDGTVRVTDPMEVM